ncbi:site-specific integrase [Methyloversatilis sp.]|uniref:site-specific integrase n=1 Tax=Methyloversatilis sp. TaxID=2569862 RepID=UPI002735DF5B|nr:site-specific integrase [Methyloversatilis sp.]MDP3457047.1 site-specific integrase [Methyloversatilis sp.]
MASIIKRGPHQFQVQIRRKGYKLKQRTFETHKDAKDWALVVESEMRRGVFVDRSEAERTTLGEALQRYASEHADEKRRLSEKSRINTLMGSDLALRSLASLRAVDFAKYRDERKKTGLSNESVRRELVILAGVFKKARGEWSLLIESPLKSIKWPEKSKHRERRLSGDEEKLLLAEAAKCKAPTLTLCIVLAIETGMRAGEIVALRWEQVDLFKHVIRLTTSKNGDGRIVALSHAAESAIQSLPVTGSRLTTFYDSRGLSRAFRLACKRANIVGLRFHDLRHEAASRFAPRMPAQTLSKVMGWRTLEMAMQYYNPNEDDLVQVVRGAPAEEVLAS